MSSGNSVAVSSGNSIKVAVYAKIQVNINTNTIKVTPNPLHIIYNINIHKKYFQI